MANEIYHRSNWGESKPEGFGDMYFDSSATNKLYNRSTYYENSDATDKILRDIPNKASIVLTPTGYSEDSINTTIPPYQVLPEELVTNGEFNEQGSWSTLSSTISISNGELTVVSSSGATGAFQNITTEVGKKYKVVALTNSFVTDALVRVTNGSSPSSGYSDNPVVNGVSFFEFTALGTTTNIYLRNTNAGTTIWQSVSVKEIQEADFTFARNSSATRVNQAGLIEDVNSGTNLATNGDFATDLSGWTNNNNYWQWTSLGAFHPFGNDNNGLKIQGLTQGNYKATFTINLIQGALAVELGATTTFTESGTYTIYGNANYLNFKRSTPLEAYLSNVILIRLDEATDIPRLDYTTGQGAFLLEPQSTNKVTVSEDFSNSVWAKSNSTVSLSSISTPNGDLNSYKLVESDTNSSHHITFNNSSTSDMSFSVFAKSAERTFVQLQAAGVGSTDCVFDLSNGTILIEEANATANIKDYGNGWYRCSVSYSASGTNNSVIKLYNGGDSYQGDASSGLYIWGAQLEELSYPTSYIPTVGSTVTRSAETANDSGNSDLLNPSAGCLFLETAALTNDYQMFYSLNDGTNNNRIIIKYNSSGESITVFSINSSSSTSFSHTLTDLTQFNKIALNYNSTNLKLYVNGILANSAASPELPSALTRLNFSNNVSDQRVFARTKIVAVFKEALTDIELEKLTSWRDFRDLAESLEYTLVTIKSDAIVVSAYGTTSGGGGVSGGGSGGAGGY